MVCLFFCNSSENIANEVVQGLVAISNQSSQQCKATAADIQNANITNNTGPVNVTLNWNQTLNLKSSCMQKIRFDSKVQQLIQQEAEQLAKSITQQFGLGSNDAKNVVNATADLAVQISNSFSQNCFNGTAEIQNVNINNNTDTVNVYANWNQYNDTVVQCVMDDAAVNDSMQQISQSTNQTATATVENWLAGILSGIVAIIAAVGVVIFIVIFVGSLGLKSRSSTNTIAPGVDNNGITSAELAAVLGTTPATLTAIK